MASITVVSDGAEEKFPLDAPTVTLGRGLESDVRLKDIKASRRHCQIVKSPEGFQVVDLSSGNGTYVNGVQVKQQALQPGDKIQVGSTTITFTDAPAPKPAAAEPAPAPRAPAVPPPPTKKISATLPVVKPPAPAAAKPSATRNVATARSVVSTRSAPKVSAEKPPPKKSSPVVVIMAVIGVVFAGVVGAILFTGSGDSLEQLKAAVRKLEGEAAAAEKAGRLDEALAKYKEVLSKIEGKEKFKGESVRFKDLKKEIEERKALLASAARRFSEIKARSQNPKDEEVAAIARDARQLLSEAGAADFAPELKEIVERLEKASGGGRRLDFQARRNEIREKHGLASPAPRYGDAISDWQSWAGEKHVTEEDRQKATAEVGSINQQARAELERLKARAASLEKDNKKAEAIDELKKQRERFRKTGAAEELEGVIGQLEK
jgi:hypothetical protein